MATVENNKLIAEFMGYRECPMKLYRMDDKFESVTIYSMYQEEDEYLTIEAGKKQVKFSPNEMEFHSSWDWLMPVVEKIGSMFHQVKIEFNEGFPYCEILCYNEDGELSKEIKEEGDNATYQAVVEFIKWYNENK